MRILFVHDNFPAQFGPIGDFLARKGWDVYFGTQRQGASSKTIKVFNYKPHREVTKGVHPYAGIFEKAAINGQAAARAFIQLKSKGFSPDVTVAHSGWGPGMYLKDVADAEGTFPILNGITTRSGPDTEYLNEKTQNEDDFARTRGRNASILTDLAACDVGLCPTRWQRDQFPEIFHPKLTVMHDGVNTDVYAPSLGSGLVLPGLDLSHAKEIVTYVARGMEPYRGFPQFMAAAAKLQKMRPDAHIVIVGEDRVAYGRKLPEGETFKKRALAEHAFDLTRLHFTGLIPRDQYLRVLQASSIHVYLTVPFVLSWSMMEAMSAGCLVLGSDTIPVRELVRDQENGLLVDFHDTDLIAEKMAAALAAPDDYRAVRAAARATILKEYAAQDIYARKEKLFASG
ncbi:MAG: glycosyltransferase [Parvularculaceae bacterium]